MRGMGRRDGGREGVKAGIEEGGEREGEEKKRRRKHKSRCFRLYLMCLRLELLDKVLSCFSSIFRVCLFL